MASGVHKIGSSGGQALVQEKKGEHTFEKLVLVHPSAKASVDVYLHGATVTSWKILGQEMLYLSPTAIFAPGKAIRGGVPVVFPQFGPGPLPQHGFARNSLWTLGETHVVQATGDISTDLHLEDSEATRAVWPHAFRLTLTILLKPTSLSMQLKVDNRNPKEGGEPFSFTALLHTYLAVEDIARTRVLGLQNSRYVDQLEDNAIFDQVEEAVTFPGEVDSKYLNVNAARVNDGGNCELLLKTTGFRDMVVWNPHVKKTAGFADMPKDDWKKFVCVEAGVVQEPVTLQPGQTWEAAQGISIALLPETQSKVAEKTLQAQQKL